MDLIESRGQAAQLARRERIEVGKHAPAATPDGAAQSAKERPPRASVGPQWMVMTSRARARPSEIAISARGCRTSPLSTQPIRALIAANVAIWLRSVCGSTS